MVSKNEAKKQFEYFMEEKTIEIYKIENKKKITIIIWIIKDTLIF